MKKISIIFILCFLFLTIITYAYDDERTHRQLTQRSIDSTLLHSYLKDHLLSEWVIFIDFRSVEAYT